MGVIMKKILFLTAYDYTEAYKNISDLGYEFYCVVPQKDKLVSEDLKLKIKNIFKNNYSEVLYKDDSLKKNIQEIKPDVLITLGWRRIINKDIIDNIPLCINVHPAILPEYKGYHPVPYVLRNNEKEHGITAHILNDKMDDGDIIYIEKFPINKFSSLKSLQYKVNKIFPEFLRNLIFKINVKELNLLPNDELKTKIISAKRTPEDSKINASKSLLELYDEIRANDNDRFPSFFYINGEKVYISLTRGNVVRDCEFDI